MSVNKEIKILEASHHLTLEKQINDFTRQLAKENYITEDIDIILSPLQNNQGFTVNTKYTAIIKYHKRYAL